MSDGTEQFRIRQAQQHAVPPTPGEEIPITVQLRLTFPPWLLEAAAAYSVRNRCGIEDVILETLRDRFGGY